MEITHEYWFCPDCTIAAANDDYSGMDDDRAAEVRDCIESLGPVSCGDAQDSENTHRCGCCGFHGYAGDWQQFVKLA